MAELKFKPVRHDHKAFLAKASKRKGFDEAYDALALEYQVANQMLKARSRAGLTQDAVAERMGTTKSGIATPKPDMDIIRARLKVAEALAQELRNAKTNH